jgi:hypothetical protein
MTYIQPFQLTIKGNENANISRDEAGWVDCVEGKYKKILINGDGKKYFEYCWVWKSARHCNRIQFGWHLHTIEAGGRRHLKLTFNRW